MYGKLNGRLLPLQANRHSCASAASELEPVISTLLQSNLQPSSLPTYQRAWKLFSQFLHVISPGISTTLPISPHVLALFVAYMYDSHYAPSTVSTSVSALGYCQNNDDGQKPSIKCNMAFNITMETSLL